MEAAAIMAIALANGGVSTKFFSPLCSFAFFNRLVNLCSAFVTIALMCFFFFSPQNKPPDWQDFVGIITLLLINSTISFIEENNAGNAAAALMARLAPKAKVPDL